MWNIQSSLEQAFEFCLSSFADEQNSLPKSTRRNLKLNKFTFGTPWLWELLNKHWFVSSVWNFCRWVTDLPPCEMSPAAKSEDKWMFLQATKTTECYLQHSGTMTFASFFLNSLYWGSVITITQFDVENINHTNINYHGYTH